MTNSKITVAAVQMLGEVDATDNRLNRAANLVQDAAKQGASLVVLPELFNTGYAYSSANYCRAETLDGPTATWMRETAAAHNIHLAGSLLLLGKNEVFNAMLPDVITILPKADQMKVTCDFVGCTKILDGGGNILSQVLAEVTEAITLAEIELPETHPRPNGPQPTIDLLPLTYAFSDYILPWLTVTQYRQGVRRAWGSHMVPPNPATRQRAISLLIISAFLLLAAYLFRQKRSVTSD